MNVLKMRIQEDKRRKLQNFYYYSLVTQFGSFISQLNVEDVSVQTEAISVKTEGVSVQTEAIFS